MLCDGNEVPIMTDGNPIRVEQNFNNRWVGLGLFYFAVAQTSIERWIVFRFDACGFYYQAHVSRMVDWA